MSISKIEARSAQGDLLTLVLDDISEGYVVEDVDGLDPVKAILASSNFANMQGQQFHGATRDIRTIKITLSFAPDYSVNQTVRQLRTRLYEFFMSGEPVFLKIFMEDGLVVSIDGVAETCEAPLFVQEPMLVCSINCYNPDFVDENEIELTNFMTNDTTATLITLPPGSVDTGFVVDLRAYTVLNEFTIYHTDGTGKTQSMQFAIPLIVNDLIKVDTRSGQKAIQLTRGSVVTSAMYSVSPQSPWIQLKKGVNQLRIYAAPATGSPAFVTYRNRFGGL